MSNNKDYKVLVEKVTGMLNDFSFNESEFCKEMENEHKTLQQSFTRLCVSWLRTCASDEYRTDGRNEYSHTIAKKMSTVFEDGEFPYLPMI